MASLNTLIDYAKSMLGLPYIWGKESPSYGVDCSGFVQLVLRSVGLDPKGDQSAQMLYDWCLKSAFMAERDTGALAFYGKDASHVSHVAILINQFQIIEAGGGDHICTTPEAAAAKGACVRIRPFGHRPDFVGLFMPDYPEWVGLL